MKDQYIRQLANQVTATIANRGEARDKQGERSMKATVDAFNALTGNQLSETDGWQFMMLLKYARSQGGRYHEDDYIDLIGYALLAAESARPEPYVEVESIPDIMITTPSHKRFKYLKEESK